MDFVVCWFVTLLSLFVWFIKHIFFDPLYFWDRLGVKTKPGARPIVGNLWGMWRTHQFREDLKDIQSLGPIYGSFEGSLPVLTVADPQVIKDLMITRFDHFTDRRMLPLPEYQRKVLFFLRGREWRTVRNVCSPFFSTGKIRHMSEVIASCVDDSVLRLKKNAEEEVEMKGTTIVLTMDVILRCVFGITVSDLDDPSNEIMMEAKSAFLTDELASPFVLFMCKDQDDKKVVLAQKQEQEKGSLLENTLGETNNQDPPIMTEEMVLAQCAQFLLAGFETTSTLLTTAVYSLTTNPDVQEKLFQELQQKTEGDESRINHDILSECKYLDHVIKETLRMYPPVYRIERVAVKDTKLGGIPVKRGQLIIVPIWALQNSSQYFPRPLVFDPDRWDPLRTIDGVTADAWLPFGTDLSEMESFKFVPMKIGVWCFNKEGTEKLRSAMTSGYGGTDSTPTVEFLSEEATMTEGADFIPDDNITLANSNSTAELPHDQVYLVAVPVLLVLSFCAILLNTTVLMSSRKIRRDNMNPFIRLTLSLTFANLLTSIVISASLLFDSLLPVGLKIKMPEFHYCFSLVIESLLIERKGPHVLCLEDGMFEGRVTPARGVKTIELEKISMAYPAEAVIVC
ncbi:unnamed protein product [Cyprideis torosa]|uniref:Uncharacterized protein n=1 Tax=Cyprideis torosa TaxID=163714 RepID=A0A7R8ZND1_9CRUS|nr:unnamed protein product [Cyprideis torosa]CAG0886054.1 unnamed protein product [Cyprideis torosa]